MDAFELLESTPAFDNLPETPTDDVAAGPLLEVKVNKSWVETTEDVFRSWTGLRRVNGEEHHGDVFPLGSDKLYTGARVCPCRTCQGSVEPKFKKN